MNVHLVAIEICIVRFADAAVEAQRFEGQYAHRVRHDGLAVQRRLAVEQRDVGVVEVALDDVALAQVLRDFLAVAREQVEPRLVLAGHDGVGARPVLGPGHDQGAHAVVVDCVDDLGEGHDHRHVQRHPQFLDRQVRVRRDHCPAAEVDPFARQVAPDASSFGLEPLVDTPAVRRLLHLRRLTRHIPVDTQRV